ncbi:hypothetical protein [Flavobacterium acetivorans]|uniref:hypothetical protein n=1 Tax=Flavobacterium acetivorans TaxID=2893883 RepID=UPI001E5D0FAE|nr:hypothetical protein [Flavobacterium sp. F-29]UFH35823.1 hypothetical protein LNP19_01965 [Flavobacterium sp. F-29]
MKKYIKFKLFISLAFLALIAVSCDDKNDPEPIISTEDYPTATFSVSNTTVNEKDGLVTVTITTDKMLTRGITFSAEQTGGTAVLHEDYDIVEATIAPYSKEAKLLVKFYGDIIPEVAKTLQIQITTPSLANRYFLNPTTVLPSYNITINNYVSNTLDISFAWNKDIDGYDTGSNIDFDIFVADAAGYDNNDPWATYNDTDYAATGDHPEVLSMNLADWPDGEYILFHDLYQNGFYGYGAAANVTVPIVATFVRAGSFSTVVTQDPSQSVNANTTNGTVDDNNANTGEFHNGFIAKVAISNGKFTVSDYNGAQLASGKLSGIKKNSRLKSILKK